MTRFAALFRLCTLVVVLVFVGRTHAQTIGPDSFGYTATAVPIEWEDISDGQFVTAPNTSFSSSSFNISTFPFQFYGNRYTRLRIAVDGIVFFESPRSGNSFPSGLNADLSTSHPTSSAQGLLPPVVNLPAVAVLWGDWRTFAADPTTWVKQQTLGQAPNRRRVIQWQVQRQGEIMSSVVKFQVILFEGSNEILLQYLQTNIGGLQSNGSSATVGIRDRCGQINGRNLRWSHNQAVITSGTAIRFVPPAFNTQDDDFDGVADVVDNCPEFSNPDQSDGNCDGVGDACGTGYCLRAEAPSPCVDPALMPGAVPAITQIDNGGTFVPFNGPTFNFFGLAYTGVFVNTNGNLTFGIVNGLATESTSGFHQLARIGGFLDDLLPCRAVAVNSSIGLAVNRLADRLVVSWKNVPEFSDGGCTSGGVGSNTFQISLMYATGDIIFNFDNLTAVDSMIGISPGSIAAFSPEIDFSAALAAGDVGFLGTQPILETFTDASVDDHFDLQNVSLRFVWQGCPGSLSDTDDDGVPDHLDNCPSVANADQLDSNDNGAGDVCESEPTLRLNDILRADGFSGGLFRATNIVTGENVDMCCIEVGQFISVGDEVTFDVVPTADAPNTTPMDDAKAQQMAELWGEHYEGDQFTALEASAFQLAVWEIVNDTDLDPNVGFQMAAPAEVRALATEMLETVDGSGPLANVVALTSPTHQDFVTEVQSFPGLPDGDNDIVPDSIDNCPAISNADQLDTDNDGTGNACDADDDNDSVPDDDDSDPLNRFICADADFDGCDDCSSGTDDANNDGTDADGDELCDAGDPDDDNDGVLDGSDSEPFNRFACGDADGDSCDDCNSGLSNTAADGVDFDGDGLCDIGDSDDDGDGVNDAQDSNQNNPQVCRDDDGDGCDDCSSGSVNAAADGTDFDADGLCDSGDLDDDNDALNDADEAIHGTNPFDSDSDDDGLFDGSETSVQVNGCPNPLQADSDGDTLSDGDEVVGGTNPCSTDTDGDNAPDNLDPAPTFPGAPVTLLQAWAQELATVTIPGIDLDRFGINANAHNNTKHTIRSVMACMASLAAKHIELASSNNTSHYNAAINNLLCLLVRIDGQPSPPDHMLDSPEKTALRAEVESLIFLLELLAPPPP